MALRSYLSAPERKVTQDVVLWECDPFSRYCREQITLRNPIVSDPLASPPVVSTPIKITDPVGYPLGESNGKYYPLLAGDEGDCKAILINYDGKELPLAADEEIQGVAIVRGPASLKLAGIATVDYTGDEFDLDDLAEALAGLNPPIVVRKDVPHQQTITR